jgi:hypothetical protein
MFFINHILAVSKIISVPTKTSINREKEQDHDSFPCKIEEIEHMSDKGADNRNTNMQLLLLFLLIKYLSKNMNSLCFLE